MKTRSLIPALLLSLTGFAQSPVASFYTVSPNAYQYTLVNSAPALDESATGANVAWNFNQLTQDGTSTSQTVTPTSSETSAYPNTTGVLQTSGDFTTTHIYFSTTANGTSLTGANTSGVTLNYSTNNAFLGLFPLSYGYSYIDNAVSGTFTSSALSGTFSGTCTTSVDAYGTLSVNVGSTPANTPVTRLKITQDLDLLYMGVVIGNMTQTTYSYYAATPAADPVFRSMTIHIVVSAFAVDQTNTSYETFNSVLGTKDPAKGNGLTIAPNPVNDVLHFAGNTAITGVTITDAAGRVVLQSKAANDIAVSGLSAGVYNVVIQAANGTEVQKMVKK